LLSPFCVTVSPYRRLLAIRAARAPVVGVVIGRLPIAGLSLATILLVRGETGSFAIAGLVEAAVALASALSLPPQARLIDRYGQTGVLAACAVLNPLCLIALVVLAEHGAAPAALAAVGAASGASVPPLSPSMRTLWASLVEDANLRQSAFALDAVLLEVAFIVGPLVVATLVAAGSPALAVIVNGALAGIGTAIFVASRASRSWRGAPSSTGWAGALRSPGIVALALVELSLGIAIGAMEISLTALATEFGAPSFAGVLISVQAAASMVGGLWYGSRTHAVSPADRYPRLILLLALGFAPLLMATSRASAVPLVALSGLLFAPGAAVLYSLIDEIAPPGTVTEASSWMITAIVAGVAGGSAIGGPLVAGGHPHRGFAAMVVAAAAGAAIAYRSRPHLRPVARTA
jgi:MFS family permease